MNLDIDAIESRCTSATAGPWFAIVELDDRELRVERIVGPADSDGYEQQIVETDSGFYPPKFHDAEFIAHAREDVPALVARIRELESRQSSHLATIRSLSQSVPLDSEVSEALNQRGALLAEVGTPRAENESLKQHILEANENAPRALTDAPESLTRRSVEVDNLRRDVEELRAEVAAMGAVYSAAVNLDDNWDIRMIGDGEDWFDDFARLEDAVRAAIGKAPTDG